MDCDCKNISSMDQLEKDKCRYVCDTKVSPPQSITIVIIIISLIIVFAILIFLTNYKIINVPMVGPILEFFGSFFK